MEPERHSRLYRLGQFIKDKFLHAAFTFAAAIAPKADAGGFGRKGKLFAAMVLGLAAASCSLIVSEHEKEKIEPKSPEDQIVVSENVHVIPDNQASQATVTDEVISFPADGNEDLIVLDRNDIIVSGYERGFLREVRGVDETEDEILIRTTQATLEQVFDKAHLEFEIPFKPEALSMVQEKAYTELPPEDNIDSSFFWDFSGTVICDGEYSECGYPVHVEIEHGRVEFAPHLEAQIDIGWDGLNYFKFEAGGDFSAGVKLKARPEGQLHAEYSQEIKVGEYWTVFWTPSVPPIPIVDGVVGYMVPGFDLDIGADVSFGAGAESSLRVGAEYAHGKWEPISEFSFDYFSYEPNIVDFDIGLEATGYIYPMFLFSLYGIAGPYLYMGPNGYLDMEVFPDCGWEVGAGTYGEIGVIVEVLGNTLAGYSETLFDERLTLSEGVCWEGDTSSDTDSDSDTETSVGPDTGNDTDTRDTGWGADGGISSDEDTSSEFDSEEDSETGSIVGPPGTLAWAKRAGGEGQEFPEGIAVCEDGSFVLVGHISGGEDILFGEGEPNETALSDFGEGPESFIARYDSNGSLLWAKSIGGQEEDYARDVSDFPDGSVVLVGEFGRGPLTFNRGEVSEFSLASEDDSGYFVAKYAPDGNLLWARTGAAGCEDVTALSDGSLIVVGSFGGSETVFGAGTLNETVLTDEEGDFFMAKYSQDGDFLWVKYAGKGGDLYTDHVYAIDSFSDGSFIISGRFDNGIIFGKGEPNEILAYAYGGGNDGLFIAKYSQEGDFDWAVTNRSSSALDVGLASDGSVIAVGRVGGDDVSYGDQMGTILEPNSAVNPFIAKYESGDVFSWARYAWGEGSGQAYNLAVFPDGSYATTGYFKGTMTFGEGEANAMTFTSAGYEDAFVAKYDSDGNFLWAVREGKQSYDYGRVSEAMPDGSLLVSGSFVGVVAFGEGTPNETTLDAAGTGNEDIFIVKYY